MAYLELVDAVLVKRCRVSLVRCDCWGYFMALIHPKHGLVIWVNCRSDRQCSLKQVISFACSGYSLWCFTRANITWSCGKLSRTIMVLVMGTWIATSSRVRSLVTNIPITVLFSIVMVSLLDFVLRIEKVEDHWLDCLLLLRVSHLLQLAIDLLSVWIMLCGGH